MLLNILHSHIKECCQGIHNNNIKIKNAAKLNRLQLAALHYNCNKDRKQAISKYGTERYSIQYPKYKKGGYIVRQIKSKKKYGKYLILLYYSQSHCYLFTGYVTTVSDAVHKMVLENITTVKHAVPPPLNSTYEKPNKEDAIIEHKSRFIN